MYLKKINKLSTLTVVLMLTGLLVKAQQQQASPDLTGVWIYNAQKSNLESYPAFVFPKGLIVKTSRDSVFVSQVISYAEGKITANTQPQKYALDGKPSEVMVSDSTKARLTFKISADRKSATKNIRLLYTNKPDQVLRNTNDIWTLSEDGKALVLLFTDQVDGSKAYTVKGIFDRYN
ncbi:MAG: hypothetical protein P0Y49_03470 [Candidatus Pedobacter colombiensis]|uniref:Lipocalin-like domain-containing protein n=1 Tax=Candidatus Pedobacter colombiensis TaxID=3121371 RepID=A0AAJ6B9H8_9SPHI|nr:hypothetical protein [Pedobacter sp.]WEK20208.1 MAG: hypothetical protein P0Y49_03470 [Pedobacter sp.]